MADELVDICDEKNNLLGFTQLKSKAHKEGLWHRSIHVWIYNSKGEILLQLRAKDKDLYPDMWDVSVAGHVSAGEEPIVSALREVSEEIGLDVSVKELQFFKIRKLQIKFGWMLNNEFAYVYLLRYEGNVKKLKMQVEEVQEARFFPIAKVSEKLTKHPSTIVPFGAIFKEIAQRILLLIKKRA